MSSAVLYLAIIAVWAGFLFPALVRRRHVRSGESDEPDMSYEPRTVELEKPTEYLAERKTGMEVGVTAAARAEVCDYVQDDHGYFKAKYRDEEHLTAGYSGDFATVPRYGDKHDASAADDAEPPGRNLGLPDSPKGLALEQACAWSRGRRGAAFASTLAGEVAGDGR